MQGQEGENPNALANCNKNSDKQKGKDSKAAFFQNTDEKQAGEQAKDWFLTHRRL